MYDGGDCERTAMDRAGRGMASTSLNLGGRSPSSASTQRVVQPAFGKHIGWIEGEECVQFCIASSTESIFAHSLLSYAKYVS
jgi:tRNA A37 threonylcarbamoyladenosine synthetase subunit TsaC/SUA5/YrdC